MSPLDLLQPAQGWVNPPVARIKPPPLSESGWRFRALAQLSRFFGRSQVPVIFSVLNIHRRLVLPWLWFSSRLMPYGSLPARVRELLILRTGWNCRCRYEWGQHVDLGLRFGLVDADIVAVARGPEAFADEGTRHLIQACDELCQNNCVSDASWQALARQWPEPQLIEIVVLVGHYRGLAGFLSSTGIALEAPIEVRLQAFHQRIAPTLLTS